jgi:N-acyl-D-aspartate/D-glutamate deacylase
MMRLVHLANAEGLAIRAQVFPRPVGILFGLDLSLHPFRFRPSYAAIEALPFAERVAAMRDPGLRARLLAESPAHGNPLFVQLTSVIDELAPLGDPPDYAPSAEATIGARAARLGVTPAALAYDLLLEREGRMILLLPASNYVANSLDSLAGLLADDATLIGLGDGGAHYGMICDASYPTFLLAHWTRDRAAGSRLKLPWAIKALSRDNALAVGLCDRGLLRAGYKADINVIDYDRLALRAPFGKSDLPAGGKRLHQTAEGYVATLVGGAVTYRDGRSTGALPGALVRGARSDPG